MPSYTFEVRSEYEGLDPDTTIALADGTSYPLGKELEGGRITTDDELVAFVLGEYPALKRTSGPRKSDTPTVKPSDAGTSGAANEGRE